MTAEPPAPNLPPHIEETVRAIARLNADHHKRATPLQRLVDRMTATVAHPWFVSVVTFTVIAWIVGNLILQRWAGWSLDGGSFPWLQGAGELTALYITTLVLMSQRRKDQLSELREQLTLELAVMSDHKSAKIIALLEEMRRDHPELADRVDEQAAAMSEPADPNAVIDAFKETQDDMAAKDEAAPSQSPA